MTGRIDGGAGNNVMGYSLSSQSVVVDLRHHTATGIDGGFAGIHDVTGSPFDDVLIADDAGDFLDGLGGNEVLIASRAMTC